MIKTTPWIYPDPPIVLIQWKMAPSHLYLDPKISLFTHLAKLPTLKWIHPVRLTWNLQITNLERNMIWTKHSRICDVWLMYNLPGCKVAILVSYPRNMNCPISCQEPKQKTTGIQYSSRASSIGVGIRRQDWKHHLLIGLTWKHPHFCWWIFSGTWCCAIRDLKKSLRYSRW